MRDALILFLVVAGCVAALRRPWIGIMLWTWLSIMNPHRFAWGFAYDAPLAAAAAICSLAGLLFTQDRQAPFKGAPTVWLVLFCLWITASWLLGLDPEGDYEQWKKVMKVYVMIFVALMVMQTRLHIHALMWVATGSIALLAIKGGIFTLGTGGNYRVWGPPGSFIADNNEMALASIMTIPLMRFMQLQYQQVWVRLGFTVAMVLTAISSLGSQSRGALIAISAMALMLWWRSQRKVMTGIFLFALSLALLAFLPESWEMRIYSIGKYEADRSAMGRISAWWTAWGIAKTYVFGVGFDIARPALVAAFSPYPDLVQGAHSIYFQILGNHGFIGLALWGGVFVSTYRMAGSLRNHGGNLAEYKWVRDLGALSQVGLVGYGVGGAFLSLAYFDLPYNIMMIVVLTRCWVSARGWERDQPAGRTISAILGLMPAGSATNQPHTMKPALHAPYAP